MAHTKYATGINNIYQYTVWVIIASANVAVNSSIWLESYSFCWENYSQNCGWNSMHENSNVWKTLLSSHDFKKELLAEQHLAFAVNFLNYSKSSSNLSVSLPHYNVPTVLDNFSTELVDVSWCGALHIPYWLTDWLVGWFVCWVDRLQGSHTDILCSARYGAALHDISVYSRCWHV